MTPQEWIQLGSIFTNVSVLLIGVRLIRHTTRLEFKVDMMWSVFSRRFGTRTESGDELDLTE